MDIVQIVGVALVATMLIILVKKQNSEIGTLLSITGGILLFLMIIPSLMTVIGVVTNISNSIDSRLDHINIVLRILGVAYIAEFGSNICTDAGEKAIAQKIDLSGKVLIMVMSAPIIVSFLHLIVDILP